MDCRGDSKMNFSARSACFQAGAEGNGEDRQVKPGGQSEDRMRVLLFACRANDAQRALKYRDRMEIAFLPSYDMKEIRQEIRRFNPKLVACSAEAFLRAFATQFSDSINRNDTAASLSAGLAPPGVTLREKKVLVMLAEGKTNDEIARALLLSPRTVKRTLSELFERLRATNRTELASRAAKLHLLDNDR